ncbi:hypothetical protein [Nesterenkonia xinjiangensis]|uniref:Uncharacterized protein n=1 Tax=Nesterenkonia xinjiangensis TaxID=225327 RepID=A0A7Z0GMN2_9MICC|nr:hypothetical protein [Nesterenkonia xinjiangensis]NYJ78797.1 hypothetical protein [Nesterenkonia xinjiangensis]
MDSHSYQEAPSPALPVSELREVLGASLVGGAGWLRARLSGVTGGRQEVSATWSPDTEQALVDDFDDLLPADQPGVPENVKETLLIGIQAAGAARQNAVVVQVLWRADHTEIAAHTLQGAGAPDSIAAALDRVAEIVTATGSG